MHHEDAVEHHAACQTYPGMLHDIPLIVQSGLGPWGAGVLGVEMKTLSVNALDSEPVNSYREVLAKKMLAMLGAPPPRRDLELVD